MCIRDRNRPTTDVLFIDASKTDEAGNPRYIKATNQNELGQEHIDAIVDAYHSRTEQPGFVPVSYTHLDVYKRQPTAMRLPPDLNIFVEPIIAQKNRRRNRK